MAVPGLLLASGRYLLDSLLGAGGFGRVWKARDISLDVDVAIKEVCVPPGTTPAETAERVERAAREARSAAKMRDHPNIVTVYDVVIERGVPWTVMQLVRGRSLDDVIGADGPIPAPLVEKVARAMLATLDACHRARIIHRDVKPANIMLSSDGTVLLTDFGIAKHADHGALTAPDMVIASVDYIAPERAKGSPAVPASDLFSLGVTLYHAVQGGSPFRRDSDAATLAAVLLDPLPAPTLAHGRLAKVIHGLTTKDPATRMPASQAIAHLDSPAASVNAPTVSATTPVRPERTNVAVRQFVSVKSNTTWELMARAYAVFGGNGHALYEYNLLPGKHAPDTYRVIMRHGPKKLVRNSCQVALPVSGLEITLPNVGTVTT